MPDTYLDWRIDLRDWRIGVAFMVIHMDFVKRQRRSGVFGFYRNGMGFHR